MHTHLIGEVSYFCGPGDNCRRGREGSQDHKDGLVLRFTGEFWSPKKKAKKMRGLTVVGEHISARGAAVLADASRGAGSSGRAGWGPPAANEHNAIIIGCKGDAGEMHIRDGI